MDGDNVLMRHPRGVDSVDELLRQVHAGLTAVREAKKRAARRCAPDFRVLDLLPLHETNLSAFLAYLLDADAAHGQGATYCRLFFEILGKEIPGFTDFPSDRYQVATETVIDERRRIDIVVDAADRGIVGIEDKPWAADQPNQLRDYALWLQKQGAMRSNWLLVYLCDSEPEPISIDPDTRETYRAEGHYLQVTYNRLIEWLEQCLLQTEPQTVQWFLREFIQYIRTKVIGEMDMSEQEEIISVLKRNLDNIGATFAVADAAGALRNDLLRDLKRQVESQLQDSTPKMHLDRCDGERHFYIDFYGDRAQCMHLCFEFGRWDKGRSAEADRLWWGISPDGVNADEDPDRWNAVREKMKAFGNGDENRFWLWWRWVEFDGKDFEDMHCSGAGESSMPWRAIAQGALAKDVVKIARKVYRVFDEAGQLSLFLRG